MSGLAPSLNLSQLGALTKAVALRGAGAAAPMASVKKSTGAGPWLRIKQTRTHTDVALMLQLAPGQWWTFSARVDHATIRRVLQKHGVEYEIGFSLGGLWKGIKKVAKATGVSKVLSVASKVLKNPIVTAVFPVASIAARATEAGVGLLNAASAAKKGTPAEKERAKKLIAAAHKQAKGGNEVAKQAIKVATRTYRITVQPFEKKAA
jgi:hypothetical protein